MFQWNVLHSLVTATESGLGECWSNCEQPLTRKLGVENCTRHNSSFLGPEPFMHKNYIARLWHGNLTAVLDFACAKGPSIVADGFDMVVIRTSATNGSVSLWGGGFGLNPECLCCVGWGRLQIGIVLLWGMCAVLFRLIRVTGGIELTAEEIHTSCYSWHRAYSWGNTHSHSLNSRNVVHTVRAVGLAGRLFVGGLDWPADLSLFCF